MLYVIVYDIPDDGRRNQLFKALKGYGTRVQYSVFEAHLNKTQFENLKRDVVGIIDSSEDSVRCYTLCKACANQIEIPAVGDLTSVPNTIVV